jgi:hypothetical protein
MSARRTLEVGRLISRSTSGAAGCLREWRELPMLWYNWLSTTMAERAPHSCSTLSATSGRRYSYDLSYRTWRFS